MVLRVKKFGFKHFEDKDHNEKKFHFSIEIEVWVLFCFFFLIMPIAALMF